ncbi:MAG: beta-lactamase family protein, partial [Flavobacteriales bacterium]|nr:beta-lactamase family protein [Flavobacteriales bacterium]
MRATFFILFALLSFSSFSQFDEEKHKSIIDELIGSEVNEDAPGIAVGIVQNGEVVYEHYRGLSNLSHGVDVTEETKFNIASTAKQFTALMVLDLALNNQISLEDDIRKYLPELYPHVEEEIKIRHVINHTSGIRDYVELVGLQGTTWWKRVGLGNGDIMELLEKQEDLAFDPGTRYSYSNSGYVLLAELVRAVTGEKF